MNGTHVCKLPKDVWCVSVCWCVWGVWLCVWCESLWLWSVSQWHDSHMYVWCVRVRVWRVSMRMCIVCVCVMSESEYVWCVSRSVCLWLWCASQCGVCVCVGYVSVCGLYLCVVRGCGGTVYDVQVPVCGEHLSLFCPSSNKHHLRTCHWNHMMSPENDMKRVEIDLTGVLWDLRVDCTTDLYLRLELHDRED